MKRLILPALSLCALVSIGQPKGVASTNRADLAMDRSLVEREQAIIEADSATPEASPTTAPFSLSRPESIVSAGKAPTNGTPGSDQSTWALFGLGASFLIFVVPTRGKNLSPVLRKGTGFSQEIV